MFTYISKDNLPDASNKPTSETGYELSKEAIKLMLSMGIAKETKGYNKSASNLRNIIESISSTTYGKMNHYISKGDVYCALEDLGIKTHNSDGCYHYIDSAKISIPRWVTLVNINATEKNKDRWNKYIVAYRDRMVEIMATTENYK